MHLEQRDFVDRPESILVRAYDAKILQLLALEVEDGVDDVLERFRPGDRSFLRDVADQKYRKRQALRCCHQDSRGIADLSD